MAFNQLGEFLQLVMSIIFLVLLLTLHIMYSDFIDRDASSRYKYHLDLGGGGGKVESRGWALPRIITRDSNNGT